MFEPPELDIPFSLVCRGGHNYGLSSWVGIIKAESDVFFFLLTICQRFAFELIDFYFFTILFFCNSTFSNSPHCSFGGLKLLFSVARFKVHSIFFNMRNRDLLVHSSDILREHIKAKMLKKLRFFSPCNPCRPIQLPNSILITVVLLLNQSSTSKIFAAWIPAILHRSTPMKISSMRSRSFYRSRLSTSLNSCLTVRAYPLGFGITLICLAIYTVWLKYFA